MTKTVQGYKERNWYNPDSPNDFQGNFVEDLPEGQTVGEFLREFFPRIGADLVDLWSIQADELKGEGCKKFGWECRDDGPDDADLYLVWTDAEGDECERWQCSYRAYEEEEEEEEDEEEDDLT